MLHHSYNMYSSRYTTLSQSQKKKRHITACEVFSYLDKRVNISAYDAVLDHGCGDGSLLSIISSHYPNLKLLGFEIDKSAYSHIATCYPQNNFHLIEDSELSFDYIQNFGKVLGISSHVLEHVDSPLLYLQECIRLTPSWFIAVPLEHTLTLEQHLSVLKEIGHINLFSASSLKALLCNIGLFSRILSTLPSLEYHRILYGYGKGTLKYFIKFVLNFVPKSAGMPLFFVENAYISLT